MSDDQQRRPRVTLEQLHDQLRTAVENLETGEQWQAWLDFARRLHRYSFGNTLLIMAQRPDATAVASYRTWKAADRQVLRGERSIKVLAPITRRVEVEDSQGQPVRDPDGRPQTRRSVVGYKPVSVFDIKQTTGPPVPEPASPALLTGGAAPGLWDALAQDVSERGYRLLRAGGARLGGANGVTLPDDREVYVRDDVDDAQAVKTLAHELAHVILHSDTSDEVCRGVREVEAESVAYLTLAAHGMTTDSYSFPYVARWAYPIADVEQVSMADVVTRTGQRVTDTARTIIDATLPAQTTSPETAALAARATASAERTATLRDDAEIAALPPIDRAALLGVVADSDVYFRSQVSASWVPTYLDERGLGRALTSHEIGYAPKDWTVLTDHLRSLGYSDEHIEAAGMATRARTGRLVDRFRDRLTLPLRDGHGHVVGFTARVGPGADDSSPKYLNSPATTIFKKGELLYGSARRAGELSDGQLLVVTEGPLDAVAVDLVAQRTDSSIVGVATCGTSLTEAHARRLVGAETICLAFDGDSAGHAAAERAWNKITDAGRTATTIAELPPGTDPASLGRDDPHTLAKDLLEARDGAYVLVDRRIDDVDVEGNPGRRVDLFRDLLDWSARVPPDQRVDLAIHVAKRLDIDPVTAASEITDQRRRFMADQSHEAVTQHCTALTHELDKQADELQTDDRVDRPVETVTHHTATAR